ncbi:MFS transporter [Nonomuraea roseoviolacea]|uniref:MFS family permease n=1 Tax=Nonomuraea roseoviolacea subsp. carminata TaxID=160689 RepID=A0ABT1KA79_9ACTN|nr:MFS transporter [Nonomuraea roseoviolacea]MCP2350514.1 MFS family permease [Nonomuraea roseoviolacea subsp. carminata]
MNISLAVARRARIAVFGYFFLAGFVMGLWAAGLPSLNDRLDLGPGRLGSVLLLISGGALVSMLVTGPLVDRWSSRAVCWVSGPLSAAVLLGPALAPGYLWLAVLAVVFGMGLGVTEVAMNTHSVEVEHAYGRPIISAFHGTWSLGGAAGGGLTALALQTGLDAQVLLVAAAVVVPFVYVPFALRLLPSRRSRDVPSGADGQGGAAGAAGAAGTDQAVDARQGDGAPGGPVRRGGPGLRWGLVAMLGLAAFAGHLSEGAAIDWAALHARWVLGTDPAAAPIAYTIFSVAMTTVRLLGDPIRGRLGSVRTIQLAGLLATCGYLLVLVSPLVGDAARVACAWTGWALAGVGLATVVPVIFSAVGAAGGQVGRALSLVTAFGYSGMLVGPAVLGYVAEQSSLPVALIVPAVLAAVVALAGAPAIRSLSREHPRVEVPVRS